MAACVNGAERNDSVCQAVHPTRLLGGRGSPNTPCDTAKLANNEWMSESLVIKRVLYVYRQIYKKTKDRTTTIFYLSEHMTPSEVKLAALSQISHQPQLAQLLPSMENHSLWKWCLWHPDRKEQITVSKSVRYGLCTGEHTVALAVLSRFALVSPPQLSITPALLGVDLSLVGFYRCSVPSRCGDFTLQILVNIKVWVIRGTKIESTSKLGEWDFIFELLTFSQSKGRW